MKTIRIIVIGLVFLALASIVFFLLTNNFSEPVSQHLVIPKTEQIQVPKGDTIINLLLLADDNVYCYRGDDIKNGQKADMGEMKILLQNLEGGNYFVNIKASGFASHQNVVSVLDEMFIYKIERYTISRPTQEELALSKDL